MGYVFAASACIICRAVFTYNPNLVPSIKMLNGQPHPNGQREPVCRSCIEKGNVLRKEHGMPPITIRPGAYESADENEINWHDNRTMPHNAGEGEV